MNITDSSSNAAFNNATNMTLLADPTKPFNLTRQTELLASVIATSGGSTYSLGLFFGLAAALVAGSFVLPVITGPILRLILQSMDQYGAYWRLFYPILLSLYVFAIYILFPFLSIYIVHRVLVDGESFHSEFETANDLDRVNFAFQLLLPAIVFLSMFQGRGPFRWFKGRGGKRGIRSIMKRFCFVLFSTFCAVNPLSLLARYDYYRSPPYWLIIIGFLPILLLLWIWAGSSIRRLCMRSRRALWHRKPK